MNWRHQHIAVVVDCIKELDRCTCGGDDCLACAAARALRELLEAKDIGETEIRYAESQLNGEW